MKAFFEAEKIDCFGVVPFDAAACRRRDMIERYGVGVDDIKSVIPFLIPYYVADGAGNLSRYARSRDYHLYAAGLFSRLLPALEKEYGGRFLGYADKSPIQENLVASEAGLGVIGDNFMLINERYGSFVFIAEILSTVAPEVLGWNGDVRDPATCSHCGVCRRACPMLAEGESECLSALTQKKGTLTAAEEAYIRRHGSVWGCDICQLACPKNAKILVYGSETPILFFHENRITSLDRETLDGMDEETFRTRAFSWRGREVLLRNLALFGDGEKPEMADKP